MIVDVHAHIVVPEILRAADPSDAWRPHIAWEDGRQVIEFGGKRILSAIHEFVDADRVLDDQAGMGIELTLLSPWVSLTSYDAAPDEGLVRSRIQNDALSAIADASGGRVAASVSGTYLGDDRFAPFWEAAERLGALVLVHPTTRGFQIPAFDEYYLWNTVGNPLETAITAAHMTMSGLMERHAGLRVVLAHGGGAFLSVRGRLEHSHTFQPQARARLQEPPLASIRRFHYDTVTHDAGLLRELIEVVGPERVLLGSDHPFDMGTDRPVAFVREAGLPPEHEELILSGNAMRLLRGGL
jgi:aminocarboxymuconate-semialdehyde decarboxylase